MVETAPVGPGLLGTIPPSISGGRPEYVLPMGYINNCRKAGMTLAAIARDIQISRTTLYKHKHLILENEEMKDDELSATVAHLKEEDPMCGEKYVTGHLRATGKKATQLNRQAFG
nr:PREDICTED: uncharacterized protein LOC109038709 [Bemisia tabaci]